MLRKLLIAFALITLVFPALAVAQPEEEEEPIQARPNPTKSREATSTAEGAPQMQMQRPEGAPQQVEQGSVQQQMPQGGH